MPGFSYNEWVPGWGGFVIVNDMARFLVESQANVEKNPWTDARRARPACLAFPGLGERLLPISLEFGSSQPDCYDIP
jgi:hypothetical protein